ncbi:hypothetical protein KKC59_02080, partial [bacterium]|nr:hypothetical protein [bacterium]
MKKVLFLFSLIVLFAAIPVYSATLDEIDTKIQKLKEESEYIQGILYRIQFLNERLFKDIEKTKMEKIVVNLDKDLGLEKENALTFYIALYKDVNNKYLITINKYIWGGRPLYMLNDIIISVPEIVSAYQFKKRFNDICKMDWFNISLDEQENNVIVFEVGSNVQMVISLPDKYSDRLVEIEMEIEKLFNLRKEILDKQQDLVSKWQLKYKGVAPIEFVNDIEEEFRRIEDTPYSAARFPWYLQLLKTMRKSGYKMPTDVLEKKILEKIKPYLKGSVTMDNIYDVLMLQDGVKNILMGEKKEQISANDKIFEFISRIKKYFITKNEGALDIVTNYYIKHDSYEELCEFLKSNFTKYNNFLDIEFNGIKDNLINELVLIRDSCGRLAKRSDFTQERKTEYQNIYIIIRDMLESQEQQKQDVEVKGEFEEKKWKDLVFQYMIFGNLFFVFMDYGYFEINSASLNYIEFRADDFFATCIDGFFEKFNTDYFRYIGWGNYRTEIFIKPWKTIIKNYCFEEFQKYPVSIKSDNDGKSVFLFKPSIV